VEKEALTTFVKEDAKHIQINQTLNIIISYKMR
jgi:hypothetical protein